MTGTLQMDTNKITGLSNPVNGEDGTNNQYIDQKVTDIKPKSSHDLENVFKYLRNTVNEWSSESNIEVDKTDDLQTSHYWNKKVLYIKLIKISGNYRFKLGLQMNTVPNGEYTICIETICSDHKLWSRAKIIIEETTSIHIINYKTRKLSFDAGTTNHH